MSADEFWKDDPQLFVSYRTSFINKKKREREEMDYKCWLQGLYIYDGNSKINLSLKQLLHNMFSKKKDTTKIEKYPTKPYSELQKDKENNNDNKTKEIKLKEQTIIQGSIKQIYLERMKQKTKNREE